MFILIFTYGYLEISQSDLLFFRDVLIIQSKYFIVYSLFGVAWDLYGGVLRVRLQKFPAEAEADGKKDQGVEHAKQGHQEENLFKKNTMQRQKLKSKWSEE